MPRKNIYTFVGHFAIFKEDSMSNSISALLAVIMLFTLIPGSTNAAVRETAPAESYESKLPYDDSYYVNRTCAGMLCEKDSGIYYANVFDNMKLYRYDSADNTTTLLTNEVCRVQFISEYDNKIYFTAHPADFVNSDNTDFNDETEIVSTKSNIYSIDPDGKNLELLIENAKGSIVTKDYIYFHDSLDNYAFGIYRMNLSSRKIEKLIDRSYECSDMTMNIVGNTLYAYTLADIITCDLDTLEIKNITNCKYKNGINKLQYRDGYLYYYTYGYDAAIMRYNISSGEEETVLRFNDGDFWYDVMLVDGENIIYINSY